MCYNLFQNSKSFILKFHIYIVIKVSSKIYDCLMREGSILIFQILKKYPVLSIHTIIIYNNKEMKKIYLILFSVKLNKSIVLSATAVIIIG